MSYRDDNDALVARNHALDEELRETRAELEALRERDATGPASVRDAPDPEQLPAVAEPSDARTVYRAYAVTLAFAVASAIAIELLRSSSRLGYAPGLAVLGLALIIGVVAVLAGMSATDMDRDRAKEMSWVFLGLLAPIGGLFWAWILAGYFFRGRLPGFSVGNAGDWTSRGEVNVGRAAFPLGLLSIVAAATASLVLWAV